MSVLPFLLTTIALLLAGCPDSGLFVKGGEPVGGDRDLGQHDVGTRDVEVATPDGVSGSDDVPSGHANDGSSVGEDTGSEEPDAQSAPDGAGLDAGLDVGPGVEDVAVDPPEVGPQPGLTASEQILFDAINAYRQENSLAPIALSYSLTAVARAHVKDLNDHRATVLVGTCNMHSWSGHGPWSACCYTPDHAQASCMWNKPREITNYPGNGYEISASTANPTTALSLWKNSSGHNAVILNQGIWTQTWRAMGIGAEGGYAHVWFGRELDPDSF
ncbi:MAG: hypothetical protein H0U74_02720 [Bradymonadaceae bacterium]|nr:hypothetical protein [Lujinxingiaceae bacterium]